MDKKYTKIYKTDEDGITICIDCNGHGVVCSVCEKLFDHREVSEKQYSENHGECGWISDDEKILNNENEYYYNEHFKGEGDGTLHCETCLGEGYDHDNEEDDYD